MQLDDDDNMQVESQGAADDDNMQVENQGAAVPVVEMLGGEPGVAQHVAAHRVEDAGSVRMAATVRLL